MSRSVITDGQFHQVRKKGLLYIIEVLETKYFEILFRFDAKLLCFVLISFRFELTTSLVKNFISFRNPSNFVSKSK